MFESQDDFSAYLQSGERIVWTGRPYRGIRFTAQDIFLVPFSLVWGGILATTAVTTFRAPGFPDLMLYLFALIGVYFIVGRFAVDSWARSRMTYALTDRRALIIRRIFGERLIAVTLANAAQLRLNRHRSRGDLEFEARQSPFFGRSWGMWTPSLDGAARFIGIEDPTEVYRLAQRAAGRET